VVLGGIINRSDAQTTTHSYPDPGYWFLGVCDGGDDRYFDYHLGTRGERSPRSTSTVPLLDSSIWTAFDMCYCKPTGAEIRLMDVALVRRRRRLLFNRGIGPVRYRRDEPMK
jgi:hypothetical protein